MSLSLSATIQRHHWEIALGGPGRSLLFVDCPWFGLDVAIAPPRHEGEPRVWTASHAARSRTGRFLFIRWTIDSR